MGTIFSTLETCKNSSLTPAGYMEDEERYEQMRKQKKTANAMAINGATNDLVQYMLGVHFSDDEEPAQE